MIEHVVYMIRNSDLDICISFAREDELLNVIAAHNRGEQSYTRSKRPDFELVSSIRVEREFLRATCDYCNMLRFQHKNDELEAFMRDELDIYRLRKVAALMSHKLYS